MSQKSGVSWLFFLPIVVIVGGVLAALLPVRQSDQAVIAQASAAQDSDSWWVANQSLTECFLSKDPQTLSEKMRKDGYDSRVTKSWQYKGRYDINWTSDGRYMEKSIYQSKGACEHDQQISR